MGLWIEQTGQGPDLVLLHGWGLSSAIWKPLREPLAARFRLTLIDLPGLGQSSALPSVSLEAMADVLLAQAPARALWLGWSLGGLVAMTAAARAPARVRGLVTLASNPCFVQRPDWLCAMPTETFEAFLSGLQQDSARTLSRFAALQTQGSVNARAELKLLRQVLGYSVQVTGASIEATLNLLRRDLRPLLAQLQLPSLHLLGAEDALVPVALAQSLKALQPQAQVQVQPGAAHLPFLSDVDAFAARLEQFAEACCTAPLVAGSTGSGA